MTGYTTNYSSNLNNIRPRVAIIGGGISGMSAGWYLSTLSSSLSPEIHLFESGTRLGGHTATVEVSLDGEELAIDTGFIVCNDRTYPNFMSLLDKLGIERQKSTMGFSVSDEQSGVEWAGRSLNSLFAQRRNLLSPRFIGMLQDIIRFNKEAEQHILINPELAQVPLGSYLEKFKFGDAFKRWYLIPMGAAIWSSDMRSIEKFPLGFFLRFFRNHGLLDLIGRPQWYTIKGGSNTYIPALTAPFEHNIHLKTPVLNVKRRVMHKGREQVLIQTADEVQYFDEVIFACHTDQALRLLSDPSNLESKALASIPYVKNSVVLHFDDSLLPSNRRCWSSWNVRLNPSAYSMPVLTYNMNILQKLSSKKTWCVSLNQTSAIKESKIIGEYEYEHPLFTGDGLVSQKSILNMNGHNRTWFCGAWLRNGFHEDGVWSALKVCESLLAQENPKFALAG